MRTIFPRATRNDMMSDMGTEDEVPFMTTAEVAALFRVDPKTVTKWVRTGLLPARRTPGGGSNGPLRYAEADVQKLLDHPPETSRPGDRSPPSAGPGPQPAQEG